MRRRRSRLAVRVPLAAALLLACGTPGEQVGRGEPADTAAGTGVAAPEPAAQVRAAMQAGPEDIVALLLAWDTAGLRFAAGHEEALRAAWCLAPEGACRGDEANGEDLVVVDGYSVETTFRSADSAQLVVTHDALGTVWPGGMGEAIGLPPATLTLRRLARGWTIISAQPPLPLHLSRTALLRRYTGVAPDSLMLARWLRER